MPTNYPGAIDTFTDQTDDVDDVLAADMNDVQDPVNAIETELGIDPAGTDATVVARLDRIDDRRRYVQLEPFSFVDDVDCETGDGKGNLHIPKDLGGLNLVEVHAEAKTAGTTGTMDIQIRNVTQAADMLSTKLTIDSTETGSDTAAAAAVIDTANDDVAENDMIAIDFDAVQTTKAKGCIVTLGFA